MKQYHKVKDVQKLVIPRGAALEKVVLSTMRVASEIVGATLGPGGLPVLLERQEGGLEPIVTKDGVTVYRSLGFAHPAAQVVMEAARSASVRTAAEAGDGTTTATILAEAIVRRANMFTKSNPRQTSQKVARRLEEVFTTIIEPEIQSLKVKPTKQDLFNVAKTSANNERALAEAVMKCYDLVGDEGNVTIMEVSGPSSYQVEPIKGYPISMGYEESCRTFYSKFINDPANQRCVMDKPAFLVYHGRITEIQQLVFLLENVGELWQSANFRHNVVVVATGFSESVLANFAANFAHPSMINVFPLLAPPSPLANGQLDFLEDIAAMTGAELLDAVNKPLDQATIDCLGYGEELTSFEAGRYRSTVVGYTDEALVKDQADKVAARIRAGDGSELHQVLQRERLAKITGGVAKLIVVGSSGGEMKEKRDRAEDAVCAVRGAVKHGCLPGGGWTLLRLCSVLAKLNDPVVDAVLIPALREPVERLFMNCGFNHEEIPELLGPILESVDGPAKVARIYDGYEGVHVSAFTAGVLDSTPAVLEAIRNSLSIASLLGMLGGTVVFERDRELERSEAREIGSFMDDANFNPADDRA